MEKEKMESMLIEYIDGNLSAHDKKLIITEISGNPEVRKLYEQLKEVMEVMELQVKSEIPGDMKQVFEQRLAKEILATSYPKSIRLTPVWLRVAAAFILLIVGGGAGYLISQEYTRHEEVEALKKEMEVMR